MKEQKVGKAILSIQEAKGEVETYVECNGGIVSFKITDKEARHSWQEGEKTFEEISYRKWSRNMTYSYVIENECYNSFAYGGRRLLMSDEAFIKWNKVTDPKLGGAFYEN